MAASLMKMVDVALVLLMISLSYLGGNRVEAAQVHHVVGGDPGWDPSSGVSSWSSARNFRVGDKIWFTHSSSRESIAELKSKEEFELCDVSNPIRMYTDGLDSISLDEKGIRYFASSNPESCKNGLKLHVEVLPQVEPEIPKVATSEGSVLVVADGPTIPSSSAHLVGSFLLLAFGFLCCYAVVGV